MNILIVEPEINGHHIVMYVRFLIRGLIKKNISFSILTSKKIKGHKSFDILKKEKKKIKFYFLDDLKYPQKKDPISLLFFQISNYFKIKKEFEIINKKEKRVRSSSSFFFIVGNAVAREAKCKAYI